MSNNFTQSSRTATQEGTQTQTTYMSGDELIKQFESGATAPASFHHADHVRLAFEYLNRYPVLDALEKFSQALLRFATALGKPDRYHETITWAYLFLIRERMVRVSPFLSWEEFATQNADLLIWEKGSSGILDQYYRSDTLTSSTAHRTFLLPDKSTEVS
jgi:hypothetical protein